MHSLSQIWTEAYFGVANELRIVFIFLRNWKKKGKEEEVVEKEEGTEEKEEKKGKKKEEEEEKQILHVVLTA